MCIMADIEPLEIQSSESCSKRNINYNFDKRLINHISAISHQNTSNVPSRRNTLENDLVHSTAAI